MIPTRYPDVIRVEHEVYLPICPYYATLCLLLDADYINHFDEEVYLEQQAC